MEKSEQIARALSKAMEKKGWSPYRLAEEMGTSSKEIKRFLTGEHNFTLRKICELEEVLQTEIIKIVVKDRV